MENLTREKFTATLDKIAKVNGVADPSKNLMSHPQ